MNSVYIHIPFCNQICNYCDFPKVLNNEKWQSEYLEALQKEIQKYYKKEAIKTIYIGGGTPSSLSNKNLKKLFEIMEILKKDKEIEFTFEMNPEDIALSKLVILKNNNVNRISVGIQTFNNKYLQLLGRKKLTNINKKIKLLKSMGFDNINIDLMYGYGEPVNNFKKDLKKFLKLKINHLSIYSLILEKNTKLYLQNKSLYSEDKEIKIRRYIKKKLKKYNRYEYSNFALQGFESKHNLTYWNNEEYYGFGLGAHGYINKSRYYNTRSLTNYIKGEYRLENKKISLKDQISNEFILGFRKPKGINKKYFLKKYNKEITDNQTIKKLIKENKLGENKQNIFIKEEYFDIMNEILVEFI